MRRSKKVLGVLLNHWLDYFSAWHGIAWLAGIGLGSRVTLDSVSYARWLCTIVLFSACGHLFYISIPFFEVEDLGW
jgi:hypothetical protein